MLTKLFDADPMNCGGKAGALGALLRAGMLVPDGFVIPHTRQGVPPPGVSRPLRDAIARQLERLGNPVVAVRSSALSEDTVEASAAGQYESVLGVRGAAEVGNAVEACWTSAETRIVGAYWSRLRGAPTPLAPGMAVLVQRLIAAEASGVLFTPQLPGDPSRIESAWGLGTSVVGGRSTPEAYDVANDRAITRRLGSQMRRIDARAGGGGVVERALAPEARRARTLNDGTVEALAALGARVAEILGGPQDIEWALAEGELWLLQARPITAVVPASRAPHPAAPAGVLLGTPGSRGTVTGTARIVRGPSDFGSVRDRDIVICPTTDPAWTPLFGIAAGVITESGGTLSHAAIVAREFGIPAVLGVPDALRQIADGSQITLDGASGTITLG